MKKEISFSGWRKWFGLGAGLFLLPSLVLNIFLFQKTMTERRAGVRVISVLDGDTFVIEGNQRIRLKMLDSPEISFCLGQEAKEKLASLVMGKEVVLEEPIVDNFGRIMALVYVGRELINQKILEAGLARLEGRSSQSREILQEAYDAARLAKKGIFSPLCSQEENLENPDCLIKGNIDKADGKKFYHLPGCPQYSQVIVEKDLGEAWFCSEKAARDSGFKKASTCP